MQVSEAMTDDVKIASPDQSIRDAARLMAQIDTGVLPVGENDRLVGMITDRDITIRAVGADKGPRTPIRDIMSKEVMYCFEDDDLDEVVQNIGRHQAPPAARAQSRKALGGNPLAGRHRPYRRRGQRGERLVRHLRAGWRAFAVDGWGARHARHVNTLHVAIGSLRAAA